MWASWHRGSRWAALAALTALSALPGRARAEDVPADRRAVILTRALAYDGNLTARAGSAVAIGVLFKKGDAGDEAAADKMAKAFGALDKIRVQGLPLHVVKVAWTGADALAGAIAADGIDAVYVCPQVEHDGAAVRDLTRKRHVVSMSATAGGVAEGFSLSVSGDGGKVTILVNLPASKAEGAAFSSELLRLAKVTR